MIPELLVYRALIGVRRFRVADNRRLYRGAFCNRCATRGVTLPHRLREARLRRVQVSAGLADVRVAEHLLNMMDRNPSFEPAASGFVSEVVKVQILYRWAGAFTRRRHAFFVPLRRSPSCPNTYAAAG